MSDSSFINFDSEGDDELDPAVGTLITKTAEAEAVRLMTTEQREVYFAEREEKRRDEERKAREAERMRERTKNRGVYDLPPGLNTAIQEIANLYETTASQVAAVFIVRGIQGYLDGSIDLESSELEVSTKSRRYQRLLDSGFSAIQRRLKKHLTRANKGTPNAE